jgi:aminoglycoside phosphotransferase (APT) family kinase protein
VTDERPAPGPLIGTGRAADVYDVGGGRVLRRTRSGNDVSFEAEVMRWARSAGYPVPEVFDVDGPDLVMERVVGSTLVDQAGRRPWTIPAIGRTLADLHRRLHAIDAPPVVGRRLGDGTALLHMDLHPLNVLAGPDGPVVIDWSNASVGDPSYDVAYVWLVMATADVPASGLDRLLQAAGRRTLLRSFLAGVDRAGAARRLGELRPAGRVDVDHFTTAELDRMDRLVRRFGTA